MSARESVMSVSGERVGREEDWKGEPLHVVPSITLRYNNNHHDLRRDLFFNA